MDSGGETISNMKNLLPKLYKDYGEYSNYRNFPLDADGLKPVERRVLLAAYRIAKHKFAKSRQVETYACGHFHPHGEAYGTLVQMVRQGFLIGQGNFGTNIGVEPVGAAAPRYTECQMNPATLDMAFRHVEHTPWIDTELDDKEPFFLPTMFPFCLIGKEYTQGIGFGYKTLIPCYDIKDLHRRLLWLLGIRKTKPTIAPITDCIITSPPKKLEKLLTTGKAKIDVEGVIETDPRKNQVVLKSWPPGKKFETFLNKFSKELGDNMIGFTDLSVTETNIVFEVLRERNRDKIFNEFVEKLKDAVKGTIPFEINVVDVDKKVFTKSVDDMLKDTHEVFTAINQNMLKTQVAKLNDKLDEHHLLAKIGKDLTDCVYRKGYTLKETVQHISKIWGVTQKDLLALVNKYKISKLLTIDKDIKEIAAKIQDTQGNLKNISDFVLQQYGEI